MIYAYQDAIYYKNPLEQEINRIEKKKRKPVYKLDLRDLEKLNHEEDWKTGLLIKRNRWAVINPNEIAKKKIYFQDIFELDHKMGIYYFQEDERRFAWYDKQNPERFAVFVLYKRTWMASRMIWKAAVRCCLNFSETESW